ncbi:hypothetical protein A2U01_0107113, partial [Trifolium medium]|nr:hypothetical protein [Trifolium medium]
VTSVAAVVLMFYREF